MIGEPRFLFGPWTEVTAAAGSKVQIKSEMFNVVPSPEQATLSRMLDQKCQDYLKLDTAKLMLVEARRMLVEINCNNPTDSNASFKLGLDIQRLDNLILGLKP